jgi:hypothetical protein
MADGNQPTGQDQNRPPGWDYSSDPLRAGGMQVLIVVVGFVAVLVLGFLLVLWMALSHHGGRALP